MSNKCAWFILLDGSQDAAQAAAAQLGPYGLPVKGQQWPQDLPWLEAAQEATTANAAVTVLIGSAAQFADPGLRRSLALFRLALQTLTGRAVNGFTLLSGDPAQAAHPAAGDAVLNDWAALSGTSWPAKLVARAHAPIAAGWPASLGLHAHERLGIWLETHPTPGQTADGALVGVAGNQAAIDFHAVGPQGSLPSQTDNQYELKGLQFEAAGLAFDAWALRNPIPPDARYYVRLDGEPDVLAVGALPDGDPQDVSLIRLA